MIRFENEYILYSLLAIPVLIILFVFMKYTAKRKLRQFASESLGNILYPDYSANRVVFKFVISSVALSLLIIALAGPRVGAKLEEVERQGREIIFALDVSNSMLAEDIKPNRLEKAKQSLNRLINEMEDDKIGLIVFAGDAYTQIPVTTDYGAARLFLNSVSTDMVSKQGTSITSAIELATRSFSPETSAGQTQARSRALIIITDGENHEDDPVDAAKRAADKGIVIHTIGLGERTGVPLPLAPGSNDFRRDKDGNVVVSKLDEKTLRQIAATGEGFYARVDNQSSDIYPLIKRLENLDKQEVKAKVFTEYHERYQIFLGFALFLILIDFLIMKKRNRWLSAIKLFNRSE